MGKMVVYSVLGGPEIFVPQSYDWGVGAQVDWYEAYADLDGERTKLQVFEMRSMASGGAFHRVYTHASQQAFLEAHELAFRYFGGAAAVAKRTRRFCRQIWEGNQNKQQQRMANRIGELRCGGGRTESPSSEPPKHTTFSKELPAYAPLFKEDANAATPLVQIVLFGLLDEIYAMGEREQSGTALAINNCYG